MVCWHLHYLFAHNVRIHIRRLKMGHFHEDVAAGHFTAYPDEGVFLRPFLNGFDVTWANRRRAYNTELSVFFLRPENFVSEMFGFTQEVMAVYSPYPTIEPRALQAIEQFLEDSPARGRVEKLIVVLITEAANPAEWIKSYIASHHESRLIVAFNADELKTSLGDAWYVRNVIAGQLFTRDLFDYRLPLEHDTYFFGREDLMLTYRDAISRGENRGLFGLRKTGKTSFLFKLRRFLETESAVVSYYDCKSPSIRKLHWYEFLDKVGKDIAKQIDAVFKAPSDTRRFAEKFTSLLKRVPSNKRVVLVFDEIEYISPYSSEDKHWRTEYLDFWQTVWAAQSEHRRLSVVIAGVNPRIVEVDRIEGVQNPLFGIVPYSYLTGLGENELRRMLRSLGKSMGLMFDETAIQHMHRRYGGHPLLSRLAASFTHRALSATGQVRPFQISESLLREAEGEREADLTFYCRHVVSELRDFYPDEYSLLEWLSAGRIGDYLEFENYPEYLRHLKSYGLVAENAQGIPNVAIAVVARYVALEEARREGRKTILNVVPPELRADWLARRKIAIMDDLGEVQRLARGNNLPSLFGPNSFPESHRFADLVVVAGKEDYESFLNACHRCFIESIDANGQSQGKGNYFWQEIKNAYPALQPALHRIRVYRHGCMHLKLDPGVQVVHDRFINQDLEGREPNAVPEVHFVLQQAILDSLWNSLQVEISRLSR